MCFSAWSMTIPQISSMNCSPGIGKPKILSTIDGVQRPDAYENTHLYAVWALRSCFLRRIQWTGGIIAHRLKETKRTELEDFWRAHLQAWQRSDLNQREYC